MAVYLFFSVTGVCFHWNLLLVKYSWFVMAQKSENDFSNLSERESKVLLHDGKRLQIILRPWFSWSTWWWFFFKGWSKLDFWMPRNGAKWHVDLLTMILPFCTFFLLVHQVLKKMISITNLIFSIPILINC